MMMKMMITIITIIIIIIMKLGQIEESGGQTGGQFFERHFSVRRTIFSF
jgi:hypothetical protein